MRPAPTRRALLIALAASALRTGPAGAMPAAGDTDKRPPESPAGTRVTAPGPRLINAAGESYRLTPDGRLTVQGAGAEAAGPEAVELYYNHQLVYRRDARGNWYAQAQAGAPWVQLPDPTIWENQFLHKFYIDFQHGDDANDGSESAPWRTFQHVPSVPPGSGILLAGIYTIPDGNAISLEGFGGAPGQPITIMTRPGSPMAKIQASPDTRNGLFINNVKPGHYIRIVGIELAGNQSSIPYEVARAAALADPVRFPNAANGTGISIGNRNVLCHDIEIRDCVVHDWGQSGIGPACCDYLVIEGNTVYNCAWYSPEGDSGIECFGSQDSDANYGVYKTWILNNLAYRNWQDFPTCSYDEKGVAHPGKTISDGEGIIVDDNSGDQFNGMPYQGRTLVAGNVCWGNGHEGILGFTGAHVDVIFNTCVGNGGGGDHRASAGFGDITLSRMADCNVCDNIAYTTFAIPSFTDAKATGRNHFARNLWYGGDPDGRDAASGRHDINADPRFLSLAEHDYTLLPGSPAKEAANGFAIAGRDRRGTMRPASGQSIGAFQ